MDFDIFISYNWSIHDKVKELDEKLKSIGFKVFTVEKELENNEKPLSNKQALAIKKSKIIICCITKKYCESYNCNLEIDYANSLDKRMIILMIEKINIEEIADFKIKGERYNSGIGSLIK